ncbi:hypothetical protein L6452_08083 [Arctium lappa]|uniref:Uncharacterized protein n=1 Tax=Arctium lappa TaxID=4217 RepID=A0ACB9DGC7_ARCLA|nr:hypothetical protein L6452_08083 [Arctium lappa]
MASTTLLLKNESVHGSPRGGGVVGALVHMCVVVEMSSVVIVGVVVVVVAGNLILEAWVNGGATINNKKQVWRHGRSCCFRRSVKKIIS